MTRGVKTDPKWTLQDRTHVRQWVAQGLTAHQIAEKVGRNAKAVRSLVIRSNLGPWIRKHETKHAPADFADQWKVLSQKQLGEHYKRGASVIQAWCAELGLVRPTGIQMSRPPKRPAPQLAAYLKAAPILAPRDNSEAGLAAQYLQRFGQIYRCDERGWQDEKGKFWRRGPSVLTAEEVIERAVYNGYQTRQAA